MATFDGWDTPQNSLMHFRTKGSKNGVRRFQNEDGTWTPLGLRERKEREGWGDEGTSRKERKAQRQLARAERHQARRQARAEAREAAAERRRKNSLKGMTDAELQQKINRLKMEQEYKELSKSPLLKTGEKMVASILEYQGKKEQREIDRNKQKIEMERLKVERTKAIESTKQAREEAAKAKSEYKKAKTDSAKKQASANLVNQKTQAKRFVADYTVRGGIRKRLNAALSSGYAERKAENRYIAAVKSDARKMERFNNKRDAWKQVPYSTPTREEFNRGGQKKNQNQQNEEQKKKKK